MQRVRECAGGLAFDAMWRVLAKGVETKTSDLEPHCDRKWDERITIFGQKYVNSNPTLVTHGSIGEKHKWQGV